jgi:hypothetical protein
MSGNIDPTTWHEIPEDMKPLQHGHEKSNLTNLSYVAEKVNSSLYSCVSFCEAVSYPSLPSPTICINQPI